MSRSSPGHALVIGGSGMLRWACIGLAAQGARVTVIARNPGRLDALVESAVGLPGPIVPLSCDYRDPAALTSTIDWVIRDLGRPDPTIAWMRSESDESLHAAARALAGGSSPARFVHVLPSAGRSPVLRRRLRDQFALYPLLRYRQVVLGFTTDEGVSRWLTDTEISEGVLRSLECRDDEWVVGRVHPWSERPGV
jgi:NAD(P)-dependent dehydrogenase (short-subunit alcohol dehydrogenase family)